MTGTGQKPDSGVPARAARVGWGGEGGLPDMSAQQLEPSPPLWSGFCPPGWNLSSHCHLAPILQFLRANVGLWFRQRLFQPLHVSSHMQAIHQRMMHLYGKR